MKNLADDRECDRTIAPELEQARIEVVCVHLETPRGDVPSRLRGRLGPIAFTRGWRYWIARGPVPLAVALDLYEEPTGRQHVYVQGNRNCPPPEEPWVRWYTREGARVHPVEHQADYQIMQRKWPYLINPTVPIVFHDEPAAIGASGYVNLYHIDSAEGLAVFTGTLRKHGIDQLVRPVWWEWHYPPATDGTAAALVMARTSATVGERAAQWDGDTQEMERDD